MSVYDRFHLNTDLLILYPPKRSRTFQKQKIYKEAKKINKNVAWAWDSWKWRLLHVVYLWTAKKGKIGLVFRLHTNGQERSKKYINIGSFLNNSSFLISVSSSRKGLFVSFVPASWGSSCTFGNIQRPTDLSSETPLLRCVLRHRSRVLPGSCSSLPVWHALR